SAGELERMPRIGEQRFQSRPALAERSVLQILVAVGEQVERDEHRRGLGGETLDAGGGGVDALAERLPVEPLRTRVSGGDDDLAVEQARAGEDLRQSLDE